RAPLGSPHPWYVLMELSSPRDDARATLESILAQGLEQAIVDDATIAANLSQRSAFWKLRDEMSAAQKPEGGSIKHDISVPVVAVPDFIEQADAAVVKRNELPEVKDKVGVELMRSIKAMLDPLGIMTPGKVL